MRGLDNLLTVSEAARQIGVTRQAVYAAINGARLRAVRKRGGWLIQKSDAESFVVNQTLRENGLANRPEGSENRTSQHTAG